MDDTTQAAYNEGAAAYRDGLPLCENPFYPLSGEWHDWQRGWSDAQEQELF
jgi:hypothetical protein